MAATKRHLVYQGILKDLRAGLSQSVDANDVYLSAVAWPDNRDQLIVQIVPQPFTVDHPVTGTGAVTETFEVHVWTRVMLDSSREATAQLTDDTVGILKVMDDVRDTLRQSTADGTATIGIVLIQGSNATVNEENYGWVRMFDTYRIGYEVGWIG